MMNIQQVKLIALNTWKQAFRTSATGMLTLILGITLLVATYIGWSNYIQQNEQRLKYQEMVRGKWLAQPDKHPHRMAHYGYLAFRPKHELSFFDFGIESFAGVSVFLEAHKQNTVNMSEAGFSSGMLRFGEMSVSMILQLLVPLLIFFLGYNSISGEREMGTLKMLRMQGVGVKEILFGKLIGISLITAVLFVPIQLIVGTLWVGLSNWDVSLDATLRFVLLQLVYMCYFVICASISVWVSVRSNTSRGALVTLVSIWIVFAVVMPKITQAVGSSLYPSPSKLVFDQEVHEDMMKLGDSHNPNDPYFNHIRDSILKAYGVRETIDLPFSYAGFIMMEGEKLTSRVYSQHHASLMKKFREQNRFTKWAGYINPYMAIRSISMALTGADFENYADFQKQTEAYRYMVTQRMNKLHKDVIVNTNDVYEDRKYKAKHSDWQDIPAFKYRFKSVWWVLSNEMIAFWAIVSWFFVAVVGLVALSKFTKNM